ncbi:MAG: transporter substrate-binding domain-containing protein [Methanocella sp.]
MKKALGIPLILVFILAIVVVLSGCTSPTPTATPIASVTPAPNATVTPVPNATTAPNFTTLKAGVIQIPVDTTFPPMEWLNTSLSGQDQFVGFDMDLMRAMAKKLNVSVEFISSPWTTILTDVESGKYDCSISSWSVTPARQEVLLFSDPYYEIQQSMCVRKTDDSIQNWTDIVDKNKIVACQMSTTGSTVAHNLTGANGTKISTANIKEFESGEQAYDELKKGTADVVINDVVVSVYEVTTYPAEFKFTGSKWPIKEPYAIILPKSNTKLAAALNWAIEQVKADGTYDQLKTKYNL